MVGIDEIILSCTVYMFFFIFYDQTLYFGLQHVLGLASAIGNV